MKIELGKLCPVDAERDAIHIAIAPVIAGDTFNPGTHIGFLDDGTVGPTKNTIGIADPFLKQTIIRNQRIYLCLYPNTVVRLRHDWHHFSFPREVTDRPVIVEAEIYVKKCLESLCRYNVKKVGIEETYKEFMNNLIDNSSMYFHGEEITSWYELPDHFKDTLEILLGREIVTDDISIRCGC